MLKNIKKTLLTFMSPAYQTVNKRAKMALYRLPDYQTSLSQMAFWFKKRSSIYIFSFQSEQFYLLLIYKSSRYFQRSFKSIAHLVQEKKFKIDFQHGCYGDHLGFPISVILAIFGLQVTPILPIKFRVNGSI